MTGRHTGGYDDNVHDSGTHLHAIAMLDTSQAVLELPAGARDTGIFASGFSHHFELLS